MRAASKVLSVSLVRVDSRFFGGVPERNAESEEVLKQCWQRHSKPKYNACHQNFSW